MSDAFQARPKMPLVSNSKNILKCPQDFEIFSTKADGVMCENVNEVDLVGLGLQNEVGEYNYYLNVIIQV